MTAPQTTPELLAIALLDEVAALTDRNTFLEAEVQRLTEALQTAREKVTRLVTGLADQQAMPDDWWRPELEAVLAALRTAGTAMNPNGSVLD